MKITLSSPVPPEITAPLVEAVERILNAKNGGCSVSDLGCEGAAATGSEAGEQMRMGVCASEGS